MDKDVAIPAKRSKRSKWPFSKMEPGDSQLFLTPDVYQRARRAAYSHGYKYGKEFRSQMEGDGGRVWRVR